MLKISAFLPYLFSFVLSVIVLESAGAELVCRDVFSFSSESKKALTAMATLKRAKIYEDGFCSTNIFNLIKQMQQKGLSLDRAEVLFIIPNGEVDPILKPLSYRGVENEWDFHTVLFFDGKIFDFDSTGQLQAPKEYFREMFGVTETESHDIWVRAIPAGDFLKDYQDHRDVNFIELYRTNSPLLSTIRDAIWYMENDSSYPLLPINKVDSYLMGF